MIIEGQDGITHINIYSKGNTALGRVLSNFARTPFTCKDGKFESIEGYWYWLKTKDDRFRSLFGYEAKRLGKTSSTNIYCPDFEHKIKLATICKLNQNSYIINWLTKSYLPFCHYYVFANGYRKDAGNEWLIEFIEGLRRQAKDKLRD